MSNTRIRFTHPEGFDDNCRSLVANPADRTVLFTSRGGDVQPFKALDCVLALVDARDTFDWCEIMAARGHYLREEYQVPEKEQPKLHLRMAIGSGAHLRGA